MNTVRTIKLCVAVCCYLLFCGCATTAPKTQITSGPQAKIALVLGAGAAKGFAHIGVLKILESSKIPLHMIVGTSVGSFVGSLYAYGYDAYALQKIAMTLQKSDVAELTIPDNGFLKGERLRDYVNTKVHSATLDKLKIPMYVVATDIKTGNSVVFNSGNTGMAVQASCSIPGVFQPARFSGASYVDGGVVNPLAVDVARRFGADIVIAVDISSGIDAVVPATTMETIMKSIQIMYSKMSLIPLSQADVVIKPVVGFVGSADFAQRNEAIMEGEKAALAVMPQINAMLAKLRQEGRLP
ncbi:MAG: patatin-like phospholipase family protein [Deltaproteobacteria bacterium]|nr:patatin-like phospholipase family protein [Deltaproteobacteria bacterium]